MTQIKKDLHGINYRATVERHSNWTIKKIKIYSLKIISPSLKRDDVDGMNGLR